MKRTSNQTGFAAVETVLVIIVLGIVGFTGWFVYHSKQTTDKTLAATVNSSTQQTPKKSTPTATTKTDPNEGYFVVKEWGLRFKVPTGLTDVRYNIVKDELAFFAKPTGSSVEYRSDYAKVSYDSDGNPYFKYAIGTLYQSSDNTKSIDGSNTNTRQGKKIGDHYYYTGWAFSNLATGAACEGAYGDNGDNCAAEITAFKLINQGDIALLNTIDLAQ